MRDPEQVTTSPKGTFFTFENMNEGGGCGSIIERLSNTTALCIELQHYKMINNNNEKEEEQEEEEKEKEEDLVALTVYSHCTWEGEAGSS